MNSRLADEGSGMMKVLHVLAGFHAAGIEQLALQLVRHAPVAVQLELLNLDAHIQDFRPAFSALAQSRSMRIQDWPATDGPALALRSFRYCSSRLPDAVMIYPCNRRLLWFALGARLAGVKSMAVHYANPPLTPWQHLQWLVVLCGFKIFGVQPQPCSSALIDASGPLIRALHLASPIPNGINITAIAHRAAVSRSQRLHDEPFTVLMTARLDAIKDHATLIEAFARFHSQVPASRLWLAGDGPLRQQLEKVAQNSGLDPTSIFLGHRSDIPALLGQADLFAYSTTSAEGSPFALIEALAAGTPILSSAVGGCPEILGNGRAGILLPPGAVDAWANALLELWRDPARRREMADENSKHAAGFDIHNTAAILYRRLLGPETDWASHR